MTFLLDVNVLMALLWENHEHHQVARRWFRQITDFATCPVTQLGFARISSHPAPLWDTACRRIRHSVF